jgi:hypothetical protein
LKRRNTVKFGEQSIICWWICPDVPEKPVAPIITIESQEVEAAVVFAMLVNFYWAGL